MKEFLSCMKTLGLTIAIVLVMQIQVGERTIENHALGWVQSSAVVTPLNSVARGAAKLVHDGWVKVRGQASRMKRKISN